MSIYLRNCTLCSVSSTYSTSVLLELSCIDFFLQAIRNESLTYDYPCGEARQPANKMLNRYRDVSPFDHSRVILHNGPCNYINASFVKVRTFCRHGMDRDQFLIDQPCIFFNYFIFCVLLNILGSKSR